MNVTEPPNITDLLPAVSETSFTEDVMLMAKKMHWITSAIVGTIFFAFGIIGNALSIKVWKKKSMRSSTGCYLIGQAVNDIGVLTFFFLTDSLLMIAPSIKTSYKYALFYAYFGYPMFFFFVVNSIWTLVGVTIDRYMQVCWINQAKKLCNNKNACNGLALISVLSFVVNSPHFNTYYPVTKPENADDQAYQFTKFGQGSGSKMYEFWVHCIFLVLVPWIIILILNVAIIRRVTRINDRMIDARGEQAQIKAIRKENQLTRLLLTVTFTFLILIALQCITQCFFMLQPIISDMRIVTEAFSVAKLGVVMNSSINFLLYCMNGKRFRTELRLIMYKTCCYLDSQRETLSSDYTSDPNSTSPRQSKGSFSDMKALSLTSTDSSNDKQKQLEKSIRQSKIDVYLD